MVGVGVGGMGEAGVGGGRRPDKKALGTWRTPAGGSWRPLLPGTLRKVEKS